MGQNNINSIIISVVTQNIVSSTILWNNNFLTSANVSQSLVLQVLTTASEYSLTTLEIKTDLYLPPFLS